jgi:hypothetical protein
VAPAAKSESSIPCAPARAGACHVSSLSPIQSVRLSRIPLQVEPFYRRGLLRQIDDNTKHWHIECLHRGDQSTQRKRRVSDRPHDKYHGIRRG